MKHKRRAKGEGSIVERSDGRWMFSLGQGRDKTTGKRRRLVLYAPTRAALMREIEDERARQGGVLKPKKKPEPGTVSAFLQRFLDDVIEPNRRRSTFELYKYLIEKWVGPFVGEARLETFAPDNVQELYAAIRKAGGTQQTCLQVSKVLHRAFALRSKQKGIPNPVSLVERPKHEAREVRVLSSKEVRAFIAAASGDPFEALWILLLTTGLRVGEALALKWSDVDLDRKRVQVREAATEVNGYVKIERPKTARSLRFVPLMPLAVEALKRRQRAYKAAKLEKKTALVFSTPNGKTPLRGNLRRDSFEPIVERAKIGKVTIHGLRHSAATLLAETGAPIQTIVEILGHTRPSTALRHYLHSNEAAQREALARLERALKRK